MVPATAKSSPEASPSRAALLDAALGLFLERGFAATRVEDIANRAGISKGAVYLHFPTKRDLFLGVVQAGVVARLEHAESVAAGFDGSASELLNTMLRENLLEYWGSESSGINKLVIAESQQFPDLAAEYYAEVTGRARQLLERILQLGIDQGEYREMDVGYTARCILNALDHEIVTAHSTGAGSREDFDPQRYVVSLLDLLDRGIARETAQ